VWNQQTGHLIDGHLRVELALKNGEKEVPVTVVDLTEEEETQVLVTFDPLTAMARANHAQFESLIAGVTTVNPAVRDLIDRIKAKNHIQNSKTSEKPVEKPENRVKLGEIWQLGPNRLACGDATDPEVWKNLMVDRGELVFTSPPYNVGYLGMPGLKGTSKKYINDEDESGSEEYLEFLCKWTQLAVDNCDEVMVNLGLVSANRRPVINYLHIFVDHYKDTVYWVKDTAAPHINEATLNNRVEPIYCFGNGKRAFQHANWQQGTMWNVITGPNASANEAADIHKATFPLYLPLHIISAFTHTGDTIVDPFMGTGTTLIACERQGRLCYGIELEPSYCDYTIARWEQETGQKAEKV
jgi:DNA modification methylase